MRDDHIEDVAESDRDTWFNPYRAPKTERARGLIEEVLRRVQNLERFASASKKASQPGDRRGHCYRSRR
jgi:hypothetical protein